jgi:basic membrane lipoprotein Med (substrate-binding protein (PBP1-ABC) superfamily)
LRLTTLALLTIIPVGAAHAPVRRAAADAKVSAAEVASYAAGFEAAAFLTGVTAAAFYTHRNGWGSPCQTSVFSRGSIEKGLGGLGEGSEEQNR